VVERYDTFAGIEDMPVETRCMMKGGIQGFISPCPTPDLCLKSKQPEHSERLGRLRDSEIKVVDLVMWTSCLSIYVILLKKVKLITPHCQ